MDHDEYIERYVEFTKELLTQNLAINKAERELEIAVRKLPEFESVRDKVLTRDDLFKLAGEFFMEWDSDPDQDEDNAVIDAALEALGPEYEEVAQAARENIENQYAFADASGMLSKLTDVPDKEADLN